MNSILKTGLTSVAILTALPAQAANFVVDMTTYGKSYTSGVGNVFTYDVVNSKDSKDKLTVQASGWNLSYNDIAKDWFVNTAEIVSFGASGLGVASRNETQAQLEQGHHQIDNSNGYEYVMLRFSQAVSLSSIGLNSYGMAGIGPDNDITILSTNTTNFSNGMRWSDIAQLSATASNGNGISGTRLLDLSSVKSNVWLISSSMRETVGNDAFKLATMNVVTPVPEPATWAMMLVGFGMVAGTARYRRRKTTARLA